MRRFLSIVQDGKFFGILHKINTCRPYTNMSEIVERKSIVFYNRGEEPRLLVEDFDLSSSYTANEVVTKVEYAGFNPVDYIIYKFAYSLLTKRTEPKTFGRDFYGTVVKVGANVPAGSYKVGDKVVGLYEHFFGKPGTMSNYLVFDPAKQKGIATFNDEASLKMSPKAGNGAWPLVFGTAYQALTNFELKPEVDWKKSGSGGKRVLVVGASTSVGVCVAQIAKNRLGATVVDGICSAGSFERNKKYGFDTLFDYKSPDVAKDVIEHVAREGVKYDVVVDCCGNSYFFNCMDDILKPKSENSYYATIAGDSKLNYASPAFPSVVGLLKKLFIRSYRYHHFALSADQKWVQEGMEMIKEGTFEIPVDSVYKPEEFEDALNRLLSNRAKGKIVISFV